jgi:hypothetical protein
MQEELMSSIDDNTKIKLDELQKNIINNNLDDNGKLSCLKAFSVAKKIGHEVLDMSAITKSMGISISNCELGVFGKLNFPASDQIIYDDLEENYNGRKELNCKLYWDQAKKYTLRKVGSTVKHSDFEVINCQLGCFREKKGKKNGS